MTVISVTDRPYSPTNNSSMGLHLMSDFRIGEALANARRELDLLRGLPAVLHATTYTARSSAASRRVIGGSGLDDVDRTSLAEFSSLLRSAAEVVDFFGSEGRSGQYASGALADTVDIAVDALLQDASDDSDPAEVVALLTDLANQVDGFAVAGDRESAEALLPIFDHLSRALSNRIGTVGETTSRL